jgi:hypothetical protein
MNLDWSGEKTVEGPPLQYLGIDACLMQQQGMVEDRERFASVLASFRNSE